MPFSSTPTISDVARRVGGRPRRALSVLLGVFALGLAACTTSISGVAASQSAVGVDRASPSATSNGNHRTATSSAPTPTREPGLVVSSIGSPVELLGSSGEPIMTLTIDAITVDPGCTGLFPMPPDRGHFVVVTLTIVVPPATAEPAPPFTMLPWHTIGPTGEQHGRNDSVPSYLCMGISDTLPSDLGVGTHIGRIALDTPHTSGQVTWTPGDITATDGWSWSF